MLSSANKSEIARWSPSGKEVATQLAKVPNVVKATYDFSVLGGAVGTLVLLGDDGLPVIIPDNAIIKQAYFEILTAFTSTGNNGTIALQSNAAGDLLATVDADTLITGMNDGIPVNTAATMIKLTADRQLKMVIATNAILTGKMDLFVEYVLGQ